MRGRGGFWNRAGRRSGGARPREIHIPRIPDVHFECPECGNDMLPGFVTSGCDMCRVIVRKWRSGELTGEEVK